MTKFLARYCPEKMNYQVIIETDNEENYRAAERFARSLIDHEKPKEWVHLGGDEWCCPNCGNVITTEGSWEKPTKKYCDVCGEKLEGGEDANCDDHG